MPVRAAVLCYFNLPDLQRLMNAVAGAGFPAGTLVHIGSYGVNAEAGSLISAFEAGRYAPMFKALVRTEAWERRRLTAEEERHVNRRFSGRIPDEPNLLRLSTAQRTGWGVELGRRYRDSIRHARQASVIVDTWQLDELGTQLAGGQGRLYREFVRGVLQGLTFGRRELTDPETKGWVWATRRALRLASLPVDRELTAFWRQLERACFRIVGEEYPDFVGDPARAARTWSDGQRALASGGPVRRALAGRYIAGMTPGRERRRVLPRRGEPLAQRLCRRAGATRGGRVRRVPLRVREQPHVRHAGRHARRRARHGDDLSRAFSALSASSSTLSGGYEVPAQADNGRTFA
ncbi:MAG: hypothetical protein E6G45_07795 [Actinobacteria bacterium]|nr:MAG: hypothetical protein E6G45_07795 [Actinomycetota bacterium]